MSSLDPKSLPPNEYKFFEAFKEQFDNIIAVKCIEPLKDFNDCVEKGVKKYESGNSASELYNYNKTKGCFEEYSHFDKCIRGIAEEGLNAPEISNAFRNRQLSVSKSRFIDMLCSDYEL